MNIGRYYMDTLKFPLSFSRGKAVVLPENTEEYRSQAIAILTRTNIGEMPLEPTYGITDPSFNVLLKSEFLRNMATFWPEIRINDVSIDRQGDASGAVRLNISFEGR
jgi:phage baseplate assembly protein W